jgi:hypothetical protein
MHKEPFGLTYLPTSSTCLPPDLLPPLHSCLLFTVVFLRWRRYDFREPAHLLAVELKKGSGAGEDVKWAKAWLKKKVGT